MPHDPRAERSRAAALDAAHELLADGGIVNLTHWNISRVSGLGRTTVYRHWPTTVDLVIDLLEAFRMPNFEPVEGSLRERLRHNLAIQRAHFVDARYRNVYLAVQSVAQDDAVRRRLIELNQSRIASVAATVGPGYDLITEPSRITDLLAIMNGPLLQLSTFLGEGADSVTESVLEGAVHYLDTHCLLVPSGQLVLSGMAGPRVSSEDDRPDENESTTTSIATALRDAPRSGG